MEQRDLLSFGPQPGDGLTRADLVAALAEGRSEKQRSDLATAYRLADPPVPASPAQIPREKLVAAAVLVPLVRHPGGLSVLLTQRTAHLLNHAGQISFPGGRNEENDASPEDAALRETEEEIGLARGAVDLLGRLDDYVTITGFLVTPVVGLVTPPLALTPDSFEVAEVFEVPLSFVMDPANHQRHHRIGPQGEKRWFYALPYEERYIWGATAAMLVNLYDVLAARWKS